MKVGDLVEWTHLHSKDIGIVLKMPDDKMDTPSWRENQAIIHWFGKPEHSGLYPIDHELLELLDESR